MSSDVTHVTHAGTVDIAPEKKHCLSLVQEVNVTSYTFASGDVQCAHFDLRVPKHHACLDLPAAWQVLLVLGVREVKTQSADFLHTLVCDELDVTMVSAVDVDDAGLLARLGGCVAA